MNIKRTLKLHHAYYCMQRSYLLDSIVAFICCEYRRPRAALEKANYYISGCCDRNTRLSFLKITQMHIIARHFLILATILGWFSMFTFGLYWNVLEECMENVILASCILIGIFLTLIPWGKEFRKLINDYKTVDSKYSVCIFDTDLRPKTEELS